MARREHHIIPNPNGGWDVKRDCSSTAVIHTTIKQAAVQHGSILSEVESTEFIIHGKDGRNQRSDRHGNGSYWQRG